MVGTRADHLRHPQMGAHWVAALQPQKPPQSSNLDTSRSGYYVQSVHNAYSALRLACAWVQVPKQLSRCRLPHWLRPHLLAQLLLLVLRHLRLQPIVVHQLLSYPCVDKCECCAQNPCSACTDVHFRHPPPRLPRHPLPSVSCASLRPESDW